MDPNLIRVALSSFRKSGVKVLVIGGQACVLYGAAQFSRDLDLALTPDFETLDKLGEALADLQAELIAVPPLDPAIMERGHAVHYRCKREDLEDLRIDVMSRMRGVDDFDQLWERRFVVNAPEGPINLISIPDLVKAKKTQRSKDWPMIERLVEVTYFSKTIPRTDSLVDFWLQELRTPDLLLRVALDYPDKTLAHADRRPVLRAAIAGNRDEIDRLLAEEQRIETNLDRAYWAPLKKELEALRAAKRIDRNSPS